MIDIKHVCIQTYFILLNPLSCTFYLCIHCDFFAFCKSLKKKLITYLNRLVPHPGWQATTCPVRGNALGAPLLLPSSLHRPVCSVMVETTQPIITDVCSWQSRERAVAQESSTTINPLKPSH